MSIVALAAACLLGAFATCDACGPTSWDRAARTESVVVEGVVTFGARPLAANGLGVEELVRPARRVDVALLDAEGRPLASGRTDENGRFRLASHERAVAVGVTAHVRWDGFDIATSPEPSGERSHAAVVRLDEFERRSGTIHFGDEDEMAGALHITDTLLRGAEALARWSGRRLPPVFAYWGRGRTVDWSYYRGEIPPGSGRHALELLGGSPAERYRADTDEHDEGIVLHELGHLVMAWLAGDCSLGGRHPPGALVDPGVAWEEGRATWFAMAVLADDDPAREPRYQDSVGTAPSGFLRLDEDIEHPSAPRGLGSERTVAGVLWDLTDGPAGDDAQHPRDRDDDGLALGARAILGAMEQVGLSPDAPVALPGFLRHLVAIGAASETALRAMLTTTGEDAALLPPSGHPLPWPLELELGSTAQGRIDGLSDPSPSGAPARPDNGIDAVRVYRVSIPRAGRLTVELDIEGSGTSADRTDLDVELRTTRMSRITTASGAGPSRRLEHAVEAGAVVVVVRDAGTGNRARYRLKAHLD